MALAGRIRGLEYHVYCLLGDGELHEGQVWEAAMTTARQRLTNVVAIIDRNRLKAMDETACGKSLDPLPDRWAAFGWAVREIDGHDMAAICDALDWAAGQDRPAAIIANTVKGKGVSFFEGQAKFHNAAVTEAQLQQALSELKAALAEEA
jgi:transketolase